LQGLRRYLHYDPTILENWVAAPHSARLLPAGMGVAWALCGFGLLPAGQRRRKWLATLGVVLLGLLLPVEAADRVRADRLDQAPARIDTGMRPEENSRLRWESIGWSNGQYGTLQVTHGKTAAARGMLPLSSRVRALIERRWEAAKMPAEGWVWATATASGHIEPSTVKKQHRLALRLSGVRPFVLYALRHTFLTRLGEAGCDAWTLARIAGHSSIAMSARYVHPSEDLVMNVFSRMDSVKGVLTESSEPRH
jgi:integrase